MKKLLLLILCIFTLINTTISQEFEDPKLEGCLLDTVYNYDFITGTSFKENKSRELYAYDSNRNRTEYLNQEWVDSSWKNVYRQQYAYDSKGNQTEKLGQRWVDGSWKNVYRLQYAYDSKGNQTEYLNQAWVDGSWKNVYRQQYAYDSNNNQIEYLYQRWKIEKWENNYRIEFVYDASNYLLTLDTYKNWNSNLGYFENHKQTSNSSNCVTTSIIERIISNAFIYPNPVTDRLHIDTQSSILSLDVYDISGQRVISKSSSFYQIDVSNLTEGIYVLHLQYANGKMGTMKFVKR